MAGCFFGSVQARLRARNGTQRSLRIFFFVGRLESRVGFFELLPSGGRVDVVTKLGSIGQDADVILVDLDKAAIDREEPLA